MLYLLQIFISIIDVISISATYVLILSSTANLNQLVHIHQNMYTSKMIHASSWGEPEQACIADLMVCHGTQTIVTAGFITTCMFAVP